MTEVNTPPPGGWPRITLVTPSYNQADFLEATLCSVLEQGYPNLQYMVIDGGSQDGSVAILERYAAHLSYWVSEPDAGQTDAILKGFARANGELLNWLNSDDLLLPGALFAVARVYRQQGANLIVGEDLHFVDDPAQPVQHFQPAGYEYPDCLRFWEGNFRYHQPCTFFSRAIYDLCQGLDRSLHYLMDYDLYCQMLAQPAVSVAILDEPLSAFRLHPQAKTSRHKGGFLAEQREVSRRYWQQAGLDETDCCREMDRYSAVCGLYQAMDLFRGRLMGDALKTAWRSVCLAPGTSLRALTDRWMG